jgi:intracellular protein transport protein USO1
MLLASLREVISNQAQEMEMLQRKIKEMSTGTSEEVWFLPSLLSNSCDLGWVFFDI